MTFDDPQPDGTALESFDLQDFQEGVESVPEERILEAAQGLCPLFGLDFSNVAASPHFPHTPRILAFRDAPPGPVGAYPIGGAVGVYLHSILKPHILLAKEELQHGLSGVISTDLENRLRTISYLSRPFERLEEFIRHYCGMTYQGAQISPNHCQQRFSWHAKPIPPDAPPESRLVRRIQQEEAIPTLKAAEAFLNHPRSIQEFQKVIGMELPDALDYISTVSGYELRSFHI